MFQLFLPVQNAALLTVETIMNLNLFHWCSLKTRVALLTLAIFLLSVWSMAYLSSRILREDMQNLLGDQQFSTVSLLADQIDHELSDRMAALETMAGRIKPGMMVNTAALQSTLEQLPILQTLFNAGLFVTGIDGRAIADVPLSTGRIGNNYLDRSSIFIPLKEGKSMIGKPAMGKSLMAPIISLSVPIKDAKDNVIGVLVGTINLNQSNFLNTIIETGYGKTGGYWLVAPQHQLFVTATDRSRIMQPTPGLKLNEMLGKYIQGYEGFGLMVNSKGVEQLSAAKGIPVAGWLLVSSLPATEAFAPIVAMQQRILTVTFLMTLLAGSLAWWITWQMLKRQLAPVHSALSTLFALSETDQPLRHLPVVRNDEIGQLIGGFNRLLDTLGKREEALKESENRFRTMADNASALIWVAGEDMLCNYFNQIWLDFTGRTTEQECGNGWTEGVHPEDLTHCMDTYITAFNARQEFSMNYRLLRFDGVYRWLTDHGVPRYDNQGKFLGFIGSCLDISELKEAEEQTKKNLHLRHQLMDAVPSPIFYKDTQGFYLGGNQAFENYLGLTAEQFIGKTVHDIAPLDLAEICARTDQALFDGSGVQNYESAAVDYHGTRHEVIFNKAVFTDSEGEVAGLIGIIIDITERKKTESLIRELNRDFVAFLECTTDSISFKDANNRYRFCSQTLAAQTGHTSWRDMIGKQDSEVIEQDTAQIYLENNNPDFRNGQSLLNQVDTYYPAAGKKNWVSTSKWPLINQQGNYVGLFGISRDITASKQAEEQLLLAASVFSHAREGILITDAKGDIIEVNEAFCIITGYSRNEVLGQNPRLLKSGRHDQGFYDELWHTLTENGYWSGEIWNRRKNGEAYAEILTISAVRNAQDETQQYVAFFTDITALKEHQRQLEHLAHFDALTNLPNRVLLADRLQQAIAQAERRGQPLAVVFLDLDGFKSINDQHGHETGDQLLITLASGMKQSMREGDTLARLGGDEFVAVLLDLTDVAASLPMLTRLLDATSRPVLVGNLMLQVSSSLGVTFYPQKDEVDADQLLRQADQAMYQAKLAGKNRYHVFDAEQDRTVRGYHESLEHIRRALNAAEFVLHYQPKVNMRTGLVIGAEALIRWEHPDRGLLMPGEFLPMSEDHPLAIDIGEWVIDTALTQIELWQAIGLNIPVSVNVGARQLQQANFVERLGEILSEHPGIQPGDLVIEILETSALMDLSHVSQIIEACREIGISFALDDFGTGYSSLTYLKRLPVTQLKIDQSFVRDMLNNPDDLAILEGILGLAKAFRRHVVAEGVETVEHGKMLLQLGCELAQGYGIARPMPALQLPSWATAWRPDPAWVDQISLSHNDLTSSHSTPPEHDHRAFLEKMHKPLLFTQHTGQGAP
ncbi:MAG: EAL domain-containing protein [Betaproteobacteria bacterium]